MRVHLLTAVFFFSSSSLGTMYWRGLGVPQSDTEAFSWWSKAAEQGHAASLNEIAYCYRNGRGVVANPVKAFEYYEKAAKHGIPAALYELGSCM